MLCFIYKVLITRRSRSIKHKFKAEEGEIWHKEGKNGVQRESGNISYGHVYPSSKCHY